MNRRMIRLGLSLVLAVSWGAGRLPAQSPNYNPGTPPPPVYAPGIPPAEVAPREPTLRTLLPTPAISNDGPAAHATKSTFWHLHECANKHGMCCSTNVDSPGCGNFRTHFVFHFGSCHEWFGEACNPRPQRAIPMPQQTGAYEGWGH